MQLWSMRQCCQTSLTAGFFSLLGCQLRERCLIDRVYSYRHQQIVRLILIQSGREGHDMNN